MNVQKSMSDPNTDSVPLPYMRYVLVFDTETTGLFPKRNYMR